MEISRVMIYGLEESIRAAKLPMSTIADDLTDDLTSGIKRIAQAPIGSGHDNWLNGVVVQFDLRASLKFWPQLQRYHFIDFVSSQSTMHRATKFDPQRQCNEYVTEMALDNLNALVAEYNLQPTEENYLKVLYNIPSGFEITARLTTNYRQLKTIYAQRRKHRLPEWREFCSWIKTLPHAELITGNNSNAGTKQH